ncbi:sigma-70 family RNA polymerase sigma factor [Streptomyces sp. NPDC050560]|uniref:sigma-70 family RNA polymerase sigma factor n=1 Tax=Streptomyces sp. NPDC050560 TaxID=3365630 RepID=UPI0037997BB4
MGAEGGDASRRNEGSPPGGNDSAPGHEGSVPTPAPAAEADRAPQGEPAAQGPAAPPDAPVPDGQGAAPDAAPEETEAAGGPRHAAPRREGEDRASSVPRQRRRRRAPGDEAPVDEGPGPMAGEPPSDSELIGRMRAGDDSAYEELFRRHSGAVRRYARTCCRDAHTADDLTAEVFASTLQAVRGGSGPEYAVRAYLLTTVRRVAANWIRSARREHLVDDFAVFAEQSARTREAAGDDTLDLGAEARAMHEAEQSMAMRAFRSLPERWQAVLWHTEVEDETPSEVGRLFGLDSNSTRALAFRAREGLKQAFIQAHVSESLAADESCARYAHRLGAYARGGLRSRAERGLRKHLEECARCRVAAGQLKEVAGGIPGVVPVAVIGWFGAAGYAKAVGLIAGGAAGAAGGGAAAAASGGGSGAAGAGAASEGVGAPVKVGIGAAVAVVAGVALALALVGNGSEPAPKPDAKKPPVSQPVPPAPPAPPAPEPPAAPPAPKPPERPAPPKPKPKPPVKQSPKPTPKPKPSSPRPKPPAPKPPRPTPPPPKAPAVYQWSELRYGLLGDGTEPEMRFGDWVWQRSELSIAGAHYSPGVTVRGSSTVTIDLNRPCSAYDALVGVDDMTPSVGSVRFSVYGDGARLWQSPELAGGDKAVPVHVPLSGRESVRLVVEPVKPLGSVNMADWATSRFTCG